MGCLDREGWGWGGTPAAAPHGAEGGPPRCRLGLGSALHRRAVSPASTQLSLLRGCTQGKDRLTPGGVPGQGVLLGLL